MSSMTYENAQASSLPSTTSISLPTTALTHEPSTHPVDTAPLGYTFALSRSSTSDSRHDRRLSLSDLEIQNAERDVELGMAPPAYEEPPVYTKKDEPLTLAMYLFKFGFVFPPFWILGAFILLSPLRAPDADSSSPSDSWLPEKTEAERQAIIDHMRKAELKWAWRCLWALIIVTILAVTAGVTISAVLRA
ncbi:hypothetical protein VKT23_014563 [Stygiomarasmius scandens]|uniref:Uncharacterized protein n=1 Tax=Marasmiellus scandens TaxID=2682957 RepID=A0ABR1J3K2_9AGAR